MGGGNYYNVIRISTLFSWGGWYSDTLKRYKVCGLVLTVQFKCEFLSNSHQDSSRIWTQDNALYSVHCAEKMYMGRLTCSSGSTRFLTFSSRDSEPSVCNEHSENLKYQVFSYNIHNYRNRESWHPHEFLSSPQMLLTLCNSKLRVITYDEEISCYTKLCLRGM